MTNDKITTSKADPQIIYIGDPMCSWCYGIGKEMLKVQEHATAQGLDFLIMVGGLRAGGGQIWDAEFKQFLANHWQQVSQKSGQQFGNALFDLAEFDYDTEPPCRAVVAVKTMVQANRLDKAIVLKFFEATSTKFYLHNEDPKKIQFYQSICQSHELDFAEFTALFNSNAVKHQTQDEFTLTRNWGVTGYPSLVFSDGKSLSLISSGFQKFGVIKQTIDALMV